VVSDFEITEQMLKYFIEKVHQESFSFFPRPRVIIGIPSGVTEVEKRAVEDAARNAGAREVFLIEEPMAAAIGAELPVQDPVGSMIIDMGGGTTEVAVISLGGIVISKSLRAAGDQLNADIVQYAKEKYNLLLGDRTAENLKIKVGSVFELRERLKAVARGRDLVTGLPREIEFDDRMAIEALEKTARLIAETVKVTIERTPPELVADIMERGIILAGGGALLRGLDRLISEHTKMPVHIANDPLSCVARGTGVVLEDLDNLREVLVSSEYTKTPY
jgi:rod shape-determining protein MreB